MGEKITRARDHMPEYVFRMMGLPPKQGTRKISIPVRASCKDAKKLVRQEYRISDRLVIQLVFKGHPIKDNENFQKFLTKMKYDPKKDTITVISQQAGGL